MRNKTKDTNKPIVETLINSAAIALTTYGVQDIIAGSWSGYVAIIFGVALEWAKYKGRINKVW